MRQSPDICIGVEKVKLRVNQIILKIWSAEEILEMKNVEGADPLYRLQGEERGTEQKVYDETVSFPGIFIEVWSVAS